MNKETTVVSALSAEYITEKTHIKIIGLSNLNPLIGPNETHYLVYKIWNQVNGMYGKSGKLAPHYGKKCMANLKTGEVIICFT